MLKEEFEELIKREVNENQYKNIETAYEALPEYMDKMYLASAISNDIGKAINVLSFLGSYISELMGSIIIERQKVESCTYDLINKSHKEIIERKSDSEYDVTILLNMYLTLAFVKEFGFKAGEAWSEITEYAYGCLSYSDFATTEMLIPEGSEHLFKDIYTAKADELYHHVLDKFGWAWRDPKYKSETELCAMLKWAKEKGLTIEELSI